MAVRLCLSVISGVILCAVTCAVACTGTGTGKPAGDFVLDDVETYLFERPDSAFAVLDTMDRRSLSARDGRARHALLLAVASGLTGEMVKSDSLADIAYGYYRKYGSRNDRLEAYCFIGNIYADSGNENSAMSCFVRAEEFIGNSGNPVLAGNLYFSKARLYEDGFGYRDAVSH